MIFVYDPAQREVRNCTHGEIEGLCFVATIISLHTGQTNRAAILNCAYELQYYLAAVTDVEVRHVHMMCPPSISGRTHWTLEELESVTVFNGISTDQSAVVNRTASASYKLGDLDLRRKKKSRVLYCPRHLQQQNFQLSENYSATSNTQLFGPLGRQ